MSYDTDPHAVAAHRDEFMAVMSEHAGVAANEKLIRRAARHDLNASLFMCRRATPPKSHRLMCNNMTRNTHTISPGAKCTKRLVRTRLDRTNVMVRPLNGRHNCEGLLCHRVSTAMLDPVTSSGTAR